MNLHIQDPTRLYLKDINKSWIPLHYAVSKSRLKIIEYILNNSDSGKLRSKTQKFYIFTFSSIQTKHAKKSFALEEKHT